MIYLYVIAVLALSTLGTALLWAGAVLLVSGIGHLVKGWSNE